MLRELEELKIPAFPVPQQDRQGRQARARDAQTLAAGFARAVGACARSRSGRTTSSSASSTSRSSAPISTRSMRPPRSFRSKATTLIARQGSALHHAGVARRPRRRADGAIARGHPAAARQGVRRPRPRSCATASICPVLIGSATRTNGVLRLMKALRHEAPTAADTREASRRSRPAESIAYVMKTLQHHARRQDVDRARAVGPGRRRHHVRHARDRGRPRVGRVQGHGPGDGKARAPRRPAKPWRSASSTTPAPAIRSRPASRRTRRSLPSRPMPPVLAIAISAKERKDDVKLGQSLNKLIEEDPSLTVVHNPETHEVIVWGQGEMHLRVATERLAQRYGVNIIDAQAVGRLSRDHQEAGAAPARPAQEAVGRPRPVRRRRDRHQAAAARRRTSSSRRRSPAAPCRATTSPRSRRASSTRSSTGRSASPWSTSR